MTKKRLRMALCASAVAAVMAGQAQAGLLGAYETTGGGIGLSWPHTVTFSNFTIPTAAPQNGSVDIAVNTPAIPGHPPIVKMFETDATTQANGGIITLNETITNTGTTAWTKWVEIVWVEACDTANANCAQAQYSPAGPGPISWDGFTSSAAGTQVLGGLNGSFNVFSYNFSTPIAVGQSFTLSKNVAVTSGTQVFGVAEFAVVPVPPAAWLMLSGLAGVGVAGRRRRQRA